MAEHWWIAIDWESPNQDTREYEIGSLNLASLASIQIHKYYDEGWQIIGTCKHGGGIVIHVYKDKEDALAALHLLQRFLFFNEDKDFIDIYELREKLAEVGKCRNTKTGG